MDKSEFLPEYIEYADGLEGIEIKVRNGFFVFRNGKMCFENEVIINNNDINVDEILNEILRLSKKFDTPIFLTGDVKYKTF